MSSDRRAIGDQAAKVVLVAGALAAAVAAIALRATARTTPPSTRPSGAVAVVPLASDTAPQGGVWVWTRRDEEVLARARRGRPGLRAAVHVATIERRADGDIVWSRALSPRIDQGAVAIVIRFDDSLHTVWTDDTASGAAVAERLTPVVADILAQAVDTGAAIDEVELDYDAPVRRLEAWTRVVAALVAGPLRLRSVWITSVPAHLDVDGYGALVAMSGAAGHIIQVFDTGLACSPGGAARLRERLAAARAPFRVGAGAFEREGNGGAHACWTAEAARFRSIDGYSGFWVFPAGHDARRTVAWLTAEESSL
jgi:hypothetical protein